MFVFWMTVIGNKCPKEKNWEDFSLHILTEFRENTSDTDIWESFME